MEEQVEKKMNKNSSTWSKSGAASEGLAAELTDWFLV